MVSKKYTCPLTIRLSPEEMDTLCHYADEKTYGNRGNLVRLALNSFLGADLFHITKLGVVSEYKWLKKHYNESKGGN